MFLRFIMRMLQKIYPVEAGRRNWKFLLAIPSDFATADLDPGFLRAIWATSEKEL
jgi:hypothetical protein